MNKQNEMIRFILVTYIEKSRLNLQIKIQIQNRKIYKENEMTRIILVTCIEKSGLNLQIRIQI